MKRAFSWLGFLVLYLLHQDVWFWDDARLVLGLPVGLTYHALYCLVVAIFLFLLARFAWPSQLEEESD